jgi:hypothetical protein
MKNALARWPTLLLWLLLLVVPRVGLAAADAPLVAAPERHASWEGGPGVPGTHGRAPLRLMNEEFSTGPEGERAHPALRIASEVGIGALTSLGGMFALGLVGLGVCELTDGGKTPKFGCLGPVVISGGLGLLAGIPVGVWAGGRLVGGEGSLLATILGGLLGVGAGIWVNVAMAADPIFLLALPLGGLAGSIIAYEFSHQQTSPARVATRPRVQPTLAISSRGALLGLGGTF